MRQNVEKSFGPFGGGGPFGQSNQGGGFPFGQNNQGSNQLGLGQNNQDAN